MSVLRLLVAGQDESELLHIKELLEAEGYSLEIVSSREQILRQVDQIVPPELIILDTVLEGTTGLQVLEQCKRRRPQQKILMIASTDEANQVVRAIKLGAEDFITKPFPPSRLRDAVCCAAGPAMQAGPEIPTGWAKMAKFLKAWTMNTFSSPPARP